MRSALALAMIAALAATGMTACSVGDDGNGSRDGRAAALVNAGPTAGGMQLTIDGITPPNKAIELMSYSWGVEAGSPIGIRNLKFTKTMDATSPLLFRGAATGAGSRGAELKLHMYGQGAVQVVYLTYTLTNVAIKSVEPGVIVDGPAASPTTLHTEEVTLSFDTIMQVVSADGSGNITPVRFGWDLARQQELQP